AARTVLYAIGTLVPRAIGFLLLPIYAKHMTPADYGVLATVDVFSTYLGITVNAGFSSALLRHFYDHDQAAWQRTAFTTCFSSAAALGVIALLTVHLALFAAGSFIALPHLHLYLGMATFTVMIEALNAIVWTLYRVEERATRAFTATLARAV